MSISIGDALLKVGIDTKDLDRGMQNLGNQIKKHQKAIGIAMVATGGAILAAGALSIKTFAQMGDEVQKMSFKIGFSTEALSEWRHVLEIGGTTLETLQKAVKTMSGAIIDASSGLATYQRAFEQIGLSVEDLMGLSPEEQFEMIAMAIAGLEDQTLKMAIATDIFGRGGLELLPTLEQGKEGIMELRQEAHDLGIVFDQEAANKAAEFTDAMHRMDEATSGLKMVIANELIPVLMPLIDRVRDIISGISGWMKEHPILTKAIVVGTTALGFLLVALGSLLLILPGLTLALPLLGAAFHLALGPIGLITLAVTALIAIGIALWRNWDKISAFFVGVWEKMKSGALAAWEALKTGIINIGKGILSVLLAPFQGFLELLGRVIDAVKKIPLIGSKIPGLSNISDVIGKLKEGIAKITFLPGELPSFQGWEGLIPGPLGKPYLAMVHGGEIISQPGQSTITNNFNIEQLVVREEADVRKVARELYRMQQVRV